MKKKTIIQISLFVVIFAALLIIATNFDYQITDLLAKSGFHDGEYYSSNVFGRIFEVIGEMPLYLFCVVASSIIIVKSFNIKANTTQNKIKVGAIITIALFALCGFGMGFYGWYKLGEYLSRLHPTTLSFLHGKKVVYGIMAIIALAQLFGVVCLFKTKLSNVVDILLPLAVMTIFAAMLSQAFVQGIKPFFGRERYRAIYIAEYFNYSHQGFTKWFVLNGSSSKIAAAHNATNSLTDVFLKDYFKSFPSGHTCACAIVYILLFVPTFVDKFNNKKGRIIFTILPIAITGFVATARMAVGAHYMSDVLVGGTTTFVTSVISYYIYKLLDKYFLSKIN